MDPFVSIHTDASVYLELINECTRFYLATEL